MISLASRWMCQRLRPQCAARPWMVSRSYSLAWMPPPPTPTLPPPACRDDMMAFVNMRMPNDARIVPEFLFHSLRDVLQDFWTTTAAWFIKRTYQPSLLRKKRQHGYLNRSKSVGGRKILRRRKAKGCSRLFGA